MKRFIRWLRRDKPQQSTAGEADERDVGVKVRPEQKKEAEYSNDSSYSWEVADRNDNSGFSNDTSKPDQSDYEDTVPQTTLELEGDPLSDVEEDVGVDPYDTGRLESQER